MPSTREIRRRIKSVKNTGKITKAMELVSASKMRRAQRNVLATRPEARNQGYGTRLLRIAERLAAAAGSSGLSIIVSDGNAGARRLYQRFGCAEVAMRPMVKERWENSGGNWVLLVKRRA